MWPWCIAIHSADCIVALISFPNIFNGSPFGFLLFFSALMILKNWFNRLKCSRDLKPFGPTSTDISGFDISILVPNRWIFSSNTKLPTVPFVSLAFLQSELIKSKAFCYTASPLDETAIATECNSAESVIASSCLHSMQACSASKSLKKFSAFADCDSIRCSRFTNGNFAAHSS